MNDLRKATSSVPGSLGLVLQTDGHQSRNISRIMEVVFRYSWSMKKGNTNCASAFREGIAEVVTLTRI